MNSIPIYRNYQVVPFGHALPLLLALSFRRVTPAIKAFEVFFQIVEAGPLPCGVGDKIST
jgi:hypothetical protein